MVKKTEKLTSNVAVREIQKTKGKRLGQIETKENTTLDTLEESVLRMRHGISVKGDAILPTNAVNEGVRRRLLMMELRALEQSGLLAEILDSEDTKPKITQNQKSQKIIEIILSKKSS